MKRTIGIDLGVTSASRVAVADGATILSNRRVRSGPEEPTRAIRHASAGEGVDVVLESNTMAWFVAVVAAVAAERAGVEHTLDRVSGRNAAALRAFYRADWGAPGWIRGNGVRDGYIRLLQRWPDLRQPARAHVAVEAGVALDRAREVRQCARDAIAFYQDRVDFDALALEFDVNTSHLLGLAAQTRWLDERIATEHQRAYPNDVLNSIPGIGPVVASVIRATIGDARDFKNASTFRAYTGLTPREDSSGDAQRRGRISEAGPNMLRWALFLAADVTRKHDPQLAALYRRLMVERGRHHNQALCAVATHLADRIYALLRENRPYQPRDLDGRPISISEAKRLAASPAVDAATRARLRVRRREGGPREPQSEQPKAPQGTTRPSAASLADQTLEHAQSG